jgi:hypothetical protein
MHLRSTPRRNKDRSEVRYLHLAHNVWDRKAQVDGVGRLHFRPGEPREPEALQRLAASVTRFLDPDAALATSADRLEFIEHRPLGGTRVLDGLCGPARHRDEDAAAVRPPPRT